MGTDNNAVDVIVSVVARQEDDVAVASRLAQKLSLPFAGLANTGNTKEQTTWQLLVTTNERTLIRPDAARLQVDFTQGKAIARLGQAARDQSLLRALGLTKLKQSQRLSTKIIDATAGLGQDAWMMASQGCSVTLIEESPLFAYLLEHAVSQAAQWPKLKPIAENMIIESCRTQDYLLKLAPQQRPDIIYLDPMFPPRKKQAKVKKGMQFLQALLPKSDNTDLLPCALAVALKRVVVKRPATAEPLQGSENWSGQITQVENDTMRFDVYHTNEQG